MSVSLEALVAHCDAILEPGGFSDYCPNGLQVEGRAEVRHLVTGVSASQALLDAAVAEGADAILVHHGYFWKGEDAVLVGMKRRRLKTLLQHDVSLLAYHLPLDAHSTLGNNAQLAARLGWSVAGRCPGNELIFYADLAEPLTAAELAGQLGSVLQREALHIGSSPAVIRRVAWCSGAAQGYIDDARQIGADAYISGEISEPTVHSALESGIHYFAAGHHATERYGVQALGARLAEDLGLTHCFIDIANPV